MLWVKVSTSQTHKRSHKLTSEEDLHSCFPCFYFTSNNTVAALYIFDYIRFYFMIKIRVFSGIVTQKWLVFVQSSLFGLTTYLGLHKVILCKYWHNMILSSVTFLFYFCTSYNRYSRFPDAILTQLFGTAWTRNLKMWISCSSRVISYVLLMHRSNSDIRIVHVLGGIIISLSLLVRWLKSSCCGLQRLSPLFPVLCHLGCLMQ